MIDNVYDRNGNDIVGPNSVRAKIRDFPNYVAQQAAKAAQLGLPTSSIYPVS